MTHRFLIDAQLPIRLARWFNDQGFEASHVAEIGLNNASDREIWRYAAENSAVIVSKDADFAQLAVYYRAGPPVIWIRLGNAATEPLLATLQCHMREILLALDERERLIEVR